MAIQFVFKYHDDDAAAVVVAATVVSSIAVVTALVVAVKVSQLHYNFEGHKTITLVLK